MVTNPTRRAYLNRTVGGLAGGIGLASGVGFVVSAASEDTVLIDTQRTYGREPKQKEVPAAWYEHVQEIRAEQRRLQEAATGDSAIRDVYRTRDERATYGGKPGLKLQAVTSGSAPEAVPPRDGVPLEYETEMEMELAACGGYTDEFDPAVGGVDGEGQGIGTTCLGVAQVDSGDDDLLLTAAHLFPPGPACETDIGADAFYQGGDLYGTVHYYDGGHDMALVKGSDGGWFDDEQASAVIRDPNGEWEANWWYTQDGIDDLLAEKETVQKMGTTTGHSSGPIVGAGSMHSPHPCVGFGGAAVTCRFRSGDGDSGCPIYTDNDEGGVTIVAMFQMWLNEVGTVSCRGSDGLSVGGLGRGISFETLVQTHDILL